MSVASTCFRFQSPNRVKPLSNRYVIRAAHLESKVSIAQSRQTSFQLVPGVQYMLSFYIVSIAQSRQTSFQRLSRIPMPRWLFCFNRPIASNLFPTVPPPCLKGIKCSKFQSPNRVKPLSNFKSRGRVAQYGICFNRPIASNLFPTYFFVCGTIEVLQVSIAQSRQTSFQPPTL